jgi:hypothetical protein
MSLAVRPVIMVKDPKGPDVVQQSDITNAEALVARSTRSKSRAPSGETWDEYYKRKAAFQSGSVEAYRRPDGSLRVTEEELLEWGFGS